MVSSVLADAPLTSSELGEVVDNLVFSVSDQIHELHREVYNALALINDNTKTGRQLDKAVSEYPDMPPRFDPVYATAIQTVFDPTITKVSTQIATGGAVATNQFLNADDTSGFPSSGTLIVGNRGEANFEYVTYTAKTPTQFSPTSPLLFDHAADESVVLATVGDRSFAGPFTVSTQASPNVPKKIYSSTSSLVIYDGESEGYMNIQAAESGTVGNTPSNTIVEFVGTAPFSGATTSNGDAIRNGQERETDGELRARLRRHRQSLSSANIDAVYEKVLEARVNDQRVVFAQVVEDPLPTLPSIIYIDDGAAFVPTSTSITSPIVLVDSAIGGEDHFFVPRENTPIVTTPLENSAYVFSGITIEKNGTPMTQGVDPDQYQVQPDYGLVRLNTPLSVSDHLEITALTYFTGLINEVNKQVYGDRADRETYPGASGLGAWLQTRTPDVYYVSIDGNIILDGTRTQSDILIEIRQNLLNYVNGLGIGGSVVRSRLIALCHVRGVKSVVITAPSADIVISDGELSRLEVGNINIT